MNDSRPDRDGVEEPSPSFLLGLGLGALIGAALALLLTPQSGSDTRDSVVRTAGLAKDKAEQVLEELRKSLDEVGSKARELIEDSRARIDAALEAGRQASSEKRAELQSQVEEAGL